MTGKQTFTFRKVQHGPWGRTELKTTVKIKAESEAEARSKIRARADYMKRLRNGDTVSWTLEED